MPGDKKIRHYKVEFFIAVPDEDTDDIADDICHRLADMKPDDFHIFEVMPWSRRVGG